MLHCESLSSISPNRSAEKGSCEVHQYCDFQAFRLLVTSSCSLLLPLFLFVIHSCMCLCVHLCKQAHQIKYIRGGHYQFSGQSLTLGPFEPWPPRSWDRTPRGSPVTLEYVWHDGEISFIVVIIISPFKPADTGSLIG